MQARVDRDRQRRRGLPLLAGTASGAVLAGVLAAALLSRHPAPAGAGGPAASPPAGTAPGGAPPGAARSGFGVEDVAFGDALRGWEVGTECTASGRCRLAVRATADGGRSWGAPAAVDPRPVRPGGAARIGFTGGRTGFVAAGGLHTSTDGGRTWVDTGLPADVVAVAPVGASVWALEGCPAAPPCAVRVRMSADGGRTWAAAASPGLAGPDATMVRVSATDAFVAGTAAAVPGGSRLAATHDGGSSWQPLADPCDPGLLGAAPAIAALEATELWTACETPAVGGGRAVFRSRDGGRHWERRAQATPDGGDGLGAGGILSTLALAPRGPVFLALEGGPLLRSPDGAAWTVAVGAAVRRIDFVDAAHGWVLTTEGGVLGTADGGRTWTPAAR